MVHQRRVIIRLIVSCIVISAYFKCSVSHCCSSLWAGSHVRIPRENYFAGGAVLLTWWGLRRQNFSRFCTSEPARRLLLFTWRWNLEAILLNSRSLVNTKFPIKVANCIPYFTILQVISNLETQRSYKITVNLKNLKLVKNLSNGSQIIYQNVYKTANKSVSINTILLSRNRLKLSPWFLTHVIKNVETTINYEGKLHFKSASI